MAMPLAVPRYSIADLDRWPPDGNRYELLSGVLLVTPGPGPIHQYVLGRLVAAVNRYLGLDGPAFVVSPGLIQRSDHTQLEPDLLVVPGRFRRAASWQVMNDWWLAVEVSGRGSRIYDRDFKAGAYLDLGVREAWRVDLRERTVDRFIPGSPLGSAFGEAITWHPPEMGHGFRLECRELFDDPGDLAAGRFEP
ncbi:MAG: Uma2 family endonuclease [Gemmatimonadetes bacterium]|nr:Uma2 family endonuclease [Gemmatimonadota bacterium]